VTYNNNNSTDDHSVIYYYIIILLKHIDTQQYCIQIGFKHNDRRWPTAVKDYVHNDDHYRYHVQYIIYFIIWTDVKQSCSISLF